MTHSIIENEKEIKQPMTYKILVDISRNINGDGDFIFLGSCKKDRA